MNKTQLNAILASYGRSVMAAAIALYASGVTDPQTLAYALLGAIAPVALRAINPKDSAFGRLPENADIQEALKKIATTKPVVKKAVKKAPVKKAAPKK